MLERVNREMKKQLGCYKEEFDELNNFESEMLRINLKTEFKMKSDSVVKEFQSLKEHYERNRAINGILKVNLDTAHKRER